MNPWKAINFATAMLLAILVLAPGNEAGQLGQFMMALTAAFNLFIGLTTKAGGGK